MRFLALLRGINVGGNNIIPMKELAVALAKAGYGNVTTYIASGNAMFDAREDDPRAIEADVERVLGKRFDYQATVVVRDAAQMAATVAAFPRGWSKPDAASRYNVLFLRHTIDAPAILDQLGAKAGVERVAYHPGVVFWSAKAADIGKTAMNRFPGSKLYKDVTIRNRNTTLKLAELLAV
jgi:uncharacterized protein (DUF1697 family)